MKDTIIKFRKTCDVLINEKGYTKGSICKEAGMSEPTLQKLLNDELDSFKRDGQAGMRSSTLAIIQDFNKMHRDDLSYAGIASEVIPMETKTGKMEFEQKNKEKGTTPLPDKSKEWEVWKEWLKTPEGKAKLDNAMALSKHPFFTGKPAKDPEQKIESELLTAPSFMESFIEALKQVPSNVTIQISINDSN